MLRLPQEARQLLKRPLGELFSSREEAFERVRKQPPARLIAVGDCVTADFLEAGLKPDVAVVDFLVMRGAASKEIKKVIDGYKVPTQRVKNPAGTITQELRGALEDVAPPAKIIVEGEEDLATIPAVLSAPLGSVVVYGQPGEGVVLVDVTEQKKREFRELLKHFK